MEKIENLCIQGERVYMRTLNIDDCSQEYVDWINDSQINRYLETRWSTQDMETVKSYVATMLKSPDNLLFGIFLKEDDRHIGNFDNIVDEVLISPFEQTYQSADVLFFGCLTSTTFGYAVNTNKPIYLVDTEGQYWNNGVYDLIKKRCTLIKSNFNQYNRLIFNEDCILKKLKEKQLEPNYEYVQKLMFPIGS